jgi:hypothetical protein
MQRILSFDMNPPLALPRRFFLTVPLFAGLAAVLLLGACFAPRLLARPAAAVLCVSCVALWINLGRATRLHTRLRRSFPAAQPCAVAAAH